MKISDFRRLSNILSKTIHAIMLCFDKVEVSDAGVSYEEESFSLNLNCYVEDFGICHLTSSSSGNDAGLVIKDFYDDLISEIDSNLSDLRKMDKKDESDWKEWRIYSHQYSCLPRIASLEMLRDLLLKLRS